MFGLSTELEKLELAGEPIRTSLIGAGTMGTLFASSLGTSLGISLDVVCDIRPESAFNAMIAAGYKESDIVECDTTEAAEKAIRAGKKVVTKNQAVACGAEQIQVVCEATGSPEIYTRVGINAINNKKHFVTMNVECDVCIGHLMNMWARQAGVVYSGIYGDEPGNAILQFYEAKALGFEVIAIGRSDMGGGPNKHKWNRETIAPELEKYGIPYANRSLYASFCDGSKTNEECCMMANATGFRPDVRGMHGPYVEWDSWVTDVPNLLRPKSEGGILEHTGVVEYLSVPGDCIADVDPDRFIHCFVVAKTNNPAQLGFWRRGRKEESPYGVFYTPYHLGSLQAPITVAKAAIDGRAVISPLPGMKRAADCVAVTKKDLAVGEYIDEIGGMCTAGEVECASVVRKEGLVPFALCAGAKVVRAIPKGGYIHYDDVEFEKHSLTYRMRMLQDELFGDLH